MVRRGSSVSVVTRLRARNPRNHSLIPEENKRFFFYKNFQTPCRAHPVSYSMGIHGSFSDDKTAGAWSQPLHTIPRIRMSGAMPLIPHMLSWRWWGKFDIYILKYLILAWSVRCLYQHLSHVELLICNWPPHSLPPPNPQKLTVSNPVPRMSTNARPALRI